MAFISRGSLFKYSLNLGVRGATIGLKFLFTLFLGKYFPEEVLGEYGLFSTTILVSYLLLSLSFDSYAVREIVEKPKERQLTYVRNELVYFLVAFCVYSLIGVLFLNRGTISNELIIYFIILLFLEMITQISFSIFTIIQKPTEANFILFINQASWIVLVFVVWFIDPETISAITDIMLIWIIGSSAACLFGVIRILAYYGSLKVEPLDWRWIRTGLPVSLLFFCAAMGYKVIEFVDRYFIEFKLGPKLLGVYVFYSQIANIINAVINVTVILVLYPRLIEAYVKKDFDAYRMFKRKMYQRVLIISVVVALGAIVFLKIALQFIVKESFYEHVLVFYVLQVSNLAMNLSFIAHYCLYAMRKDTALVLTTLVGSATSIILNLVLIDYFGLIGAAIATCSSFVIIGVLKYFYVQKQERLLFQ